MWICDGSEKILGELASKNNPDDLLNTKLINDLGYMVGESYDSSRYDIESMVSRVSSKINKVSTRSQASRVASWINKIKFAIKGAVS